MRLTSHLTLLTLTLNRQLSTARSLVKSPSNHLQTMQLATLSATGPDRSNQPIKSRPNFTKCSEIHWKAAGRTSWFKPFWSHLHTACWLSGPQNATHYWKPISEVACLRNLWKTECTLLWTHQEQQILTRKQPLPNSWLWRTDETSTQNTDDIFNVNFQVNMSRPIL